MDIKGLYTAEIHEQGAELQVKDQSGKPMDCYIKVVGTDSTRWRSIVRDKMRSLVADDDITDSATLLAKATIGWRGFEENGKPYDFTEDRAAELYRNAPYISDQVDRFIANRANFMNDSAKK